VQLHRVNLVKNNRSSGTRRKKVESPLKKNKNLLPKMGVQHNKLNKIKKINNSPNWIKKYKFKGNTNSY
jgi:hypothetical protein